MDSNMDHHSSSLRASSYCASKINIIHWFEPIKLTNFVKWYTPRVSAANEANACQHVINDDYINIFFPTKLHTRDGQTLQGRDVVCSKLGIAHPCVFWSEYSITYSLVSKEHSKIETLKRLLPFSEYKIHTFD